MPVASNRSGGQALVAQKCDEMLGEDLGNEDVCKVLLPLDDDESRIGQGRDDGLGVVPDTVRALATGQDKHRHPDSSRLLGIEAVGVERPDLSSDRVHGADSQLPRRLYPDGPDLRVRHLCDLTHEEFERPVSITGGNEPVQALFDVAREVQLLGRDRRPPFVENNAANVRL